MAGRALAGRTTPSALRKVVDAEELLAMRRSLGRVTVDPDLIRDAVELVGGDPDPPAGRHRREPAAPSPWSASAGRALRGTAAQRMHSRGHKGCCGARAGAPTKPAPGDVGSADHR